MIPPQLCYQVLCTLHAAHQRVSAMERRARATVFWPGMTQDIHNIRDSCAHRNQNAPSQVATSPLPSHPPTTPFEKIFADYFDYALLDRWRQIVRLVRCIWYTCWDHRHWRKCTCSPPSIILCHFWSA